MLDRNYAVVLEPSTPHYWALYPNYFTADECDRIIQEGLAIPDVTSTVGGHGHIDNTIRQARVAFFDPKATNTKWLFERMRGLALEMNRQFWNFDIKFLECIQFSRYEQPGDFYTSHMDMSYDPSEVRKLSISVQLSPATSYQGSDLRLFRVGDDMDTAPRDQGTVILFPSYHVHQVTPLIAGKRYSLVSWLVGPPLK